MTGFGESSVSQSDPPAISAEQAEAALARVTESEHFAKSTRQRSLLRFLVMEALADRGDQLKEFTIGLEVFDRDASFDPQTNPIVRVEASRLRRRLEQYYLTEGAGDPIRIELPKGAYVPSFALATSVAGRDADDKAGRRLATGWWLTPKMAFSVAILSLAIAGAAIWDAYYREPDLAVTLPDGPSIAVLPFTNMSGDPEQDYFADGITDEILTDLARFRDLFVFARNTTFQYKGKAVDVRRLRQELGVDYVLEGSVRRADHHVRITAQLLNAETGAHLWTDSFDEDLSAKNLLDAQKDISGHVVATIGNRYGIIGSANLVATETQSPDDFGAYDCFLRFHAYWLNENPTTHGEARSCLERAVEDEPNYANAWAGLAFTHVDELRFQFNSRPEAPPPLDRALKAAKRAVQIDPTNGTAYHALSLAHFHRHEIDQFRKAAKRALELNPNNAPLLADIGFSFGLIGEWERGLALGRKAIALNPAHPYWYHAVFFWDHFRNGDYRQALVRAEAYPQDFFWTPAHKAMAYGQLGDEPAAEQAVDHLAELKPDFAENFWILTAAWPMSQDLIDHMADGLRKAGMTLPPKPAGEAS